MDSPFDVLGISPDADEAEIDRAYRQRVKEAHPDHGGSTSEFQLVRMAYEELQVGDSVDTKAVESDTDGPEEEEPQTRVEYLNYEVLDDYGWSLDDEDLFSNAASADLSPTDFGQFLVRPHESLLEAAENRGFTWPFACRGGACANCAVAVIAGEIAMPVNHVLPTEILDRGIRLSCNAMPITEELKVVYNVKHLPYLDELRLPPRPFEQACLGD
ncbi:ferredoxin Fer [Halocatena marina]|uniref:Ferredoxin Fer n=1 Tax=Halocatena marina TaxID=2934937 RepID=A0ABD5YKJ5_9EURY|nr:ferredoxin Fer [Halocatena marina]